MHWCPCLFILACINELLERTVVRLLCFFLVFFVRDWEVRALLCDCDPLVGVLLLGGQHGCCTTWHKQDRQPFWLFRLSSLDAECCAESGIREVYIFFMSWNNVARDIASIWESTIVSTKERLEVSVCAAGVSGDVDGQIWRVVAIATVDNFLFIFLPSQLWSGEPMWLH